MSGQIPRADTTATQKTPPAPERRASDAALSKYADFAIDDLTKLIGEAVRLGNDDLVARLDRVLRRVEAMAEFSKGSPTDRRKH